MSLNCSLSFTSIQPMLMHQPTNDERIVWHGGNSTQLHYECLINNEWKSLETQTLMKFPHGVKEFKQAMVEFYDYCSPIYCKES